MINFNDRATDKKLQEFANYMIELQEKIGFKVSARGWCYTMETERLVNKNQFNKVEGWINKCRRKGYLPIDFVADDSSRMFHGVEKMDVKTYEQHIGRWVKAMYNIPDYYDPNWWDNEEYYIQMIVEKVDLVTLAKPVLEKYHIPIANAKGWSSMLQRAQYARRFMEAELKGLKCVLLYFGDHDPDGLRIADNLRKNLYDIQKVTWADGEEGYDPSDLIIDRMGLKYEFIEENNLTWIDNLITGSDKDLASRGHKNYNLPYMQKYLKTIGIRKCEANACVTIPEITRDYIDERIQYYYGAGAAGRFLGKKERAMEKVREIMEDKGIIDLVQGAIDRLE